MAESQNKRFTVNPDNEDQDYNQFRIAVNAADSDDFEMGRMRVAPFFTSGNRLLKILSEDVGVDLLLVATTDEASLIDFTVREGDGFLTSNEARVRHTAKAIIDELGIVSNMNLFNQQFPEGIE